MGRIFDTAISGADKAPPKGSCRVCTEHASRAEPHNTKHRSYELIGDWSEAGAAVQHAREAQKTFNTAALQAQVGALKVVAFGFAGDVLFEGVPYSVPARDERTDKAKSKAS